MFYARTNSQANGPDSLAARARDLGTSAGQTATVAAQGVSSAAQTAAVSVNKGVRQGVYAVRVWAAPRLESAADYTTTTAAPKVSSALLITARQIRPEDVTQKKGRSVLTWSILGAAVLTALGAVAALVMYRNRAEMAVEADEDFEPLTPAGSQPAATGAADAASAESAPADSAAGSDTGVNGRVSTSGW